MARSPWLPLLVLTLLIFFGATPVGPVQSSVTGERVQGDVNCDQTVNSIDSLQILRSVAGLSTSAGCLAEAGDVNCDGALNSVDSLRILRYVAGLTNGVVDGCAAIGDPLAPPPTSEALIAAALQAGDITYEQSLLYRALALYDWPGLPDEYRSPIIDYSAAVRLFGEVETNRDQLSQGLLDQLAPFMARPNDPISVFNNPPSPQAAAAGPAPTWRSAAAAGTNVRVWVKDVSDGPLAGYAIAVSTVWPKLQQVFGLPNPDKIASPATAVNPDTRIDIYFASTAEIDPRDLACTVDCTLATANGLTTPIDLNGQTSSAYIMVRNSLTGDDLLKVVAHELAHAVQDKYDFNEPAWLGDATADWAAFRVLQELGTATRSNLFRRAKIVIDNYSQPLTRDVGESRYAAWVYFLFASMERGDGIVKSIWQDAAAAGKQNEKAADHVFPFDDWFDNFTVRNWNQDSVDPMYKDAKAGDTAPYPASIVPKIPAARDRTFGGSTSVTEEAVLPPLSSFYYRYTFEGDVRNVDFYPLLNANPHAHWWAIVKIGNDWKAPEDWSTTESKTFCRDIADEDISEVILILSNSDMNDDMPGGPKLHVDVGETGCPGWAGWAQATVHINDPNQETDMMYTTQRVNVRFEPKPVQDQPGDTRYDLKVGDAVQWHASGTYFGCPAVGDARVVFTGEVYDPVRSTAAGYMNVVSQGNGDFHSIIIVAANLTDKMTVTCPGSAPREELIPMGYLMDMIYEPNTHDGDELILKGHQVQPNATMPLPPGWSITYDWELHKVGP